MSTMLITGGNTGLGFEAASQLAAEGVDLILAGRDADRTGSAASDLRTRYGATVSTLALDLASLRSVRAAADTVRERIAAGGLAPLDALLLNAGAQFHSPVSYSEDGIEETFAANCLGHFLFANLLIDSLAENARVVFTASGTHDPATTDGKMVGAAAEPDAFVLANQGKHGKPLSGGRRYSTSKLCTILYAYELAKRLATGRKRVAAIAFDPGFVPETGLMRQAPVVAQRLLRTALAKWLLKRAGGTMESASNSGKALALLASAPEFATASGRYFHARDGALVEARSSAASYDRAKAAKLWRDSELLAGLQTEGRPLITR